MQYTVKQGDCISSIAASCGMRWNTIWDHPDNSDLKQKRKDPNVLYAGDTVSIPDRESKQQSCATDGLHKFNKKAQPTRVKIRLLLDDQPRGNMAYELHVGSASISGSTDGDGYLEEEVPPDIRTGLLIVTEGTIRDVFQLGFGTLDPIATDDGVKQRLEALGFNAELDLSAAVRGFQSKNGLDATGVIDDSLKGKLQEVFGQ